MLALIFVGIFFLVSGTLGGGSADAQCDEELPPLGSSEVNAETFQEEDEALTAVMALLNQGDRAGAEAAFYGPAHNFTHNVDPPLRAEDEDLAKELCRAVLELEESFINGSSPAVATDVERVRDILRDAAEILGYPRPG